MGIMFYLIACEVTFKKVFLGLFAISCILITIECASIFLLGVGVNSSFFYYLFYSGELEGKHIILSGLKFSLLLLAALYIALYIVKRFRLFSNLKMRCASSVSLVCVIISILISPVCKEFYSFYLYKGDSENNSHAELNIVNKYDLSKLSAKKKISGGAPNLIFIFAESLERSYLASKIQSKYFKPLNDIEKNSIYFENIKQLNDSNFTIAGMVGSLCGIPLTHPSGNNSLGAVDEFYPGARCFGDVLKEFGYDLSFIQGSNIKFSGIKQLYEQHGFDIVKGKDYFIRKHPDYKMHEWGIYDDNLLDEAYSIFKDRIKLGPQALFLATIDSHYPYGYISKSCKGEINENLNPPIISAASCSSYQISNFIKKIRSNKDTKDSIIVVVSDHLGMGAETQSIFQDVERSNLFFINLPKQAKGKAVPKVGSQLDIATTVLNVLGINEKIGVGINLLGKDNSLAKDKNVEKILSANKNYFLKLWEFPTSDSDISFKKESIEIGKKRYKTPVLLRLATNKSIKPYYKEDAGSFHRYISSFNKSDAYLVVDECQELNYLVDSKYRESGICYALGRVGVSSELGDFSLGKVVSREKVSQILMRKVDSKYYQQESRKLDALGVLTANQRWLLNNIPSKSNVFMDKDVYLPFEDYIVTRSKIEKYYDVKISYNRSFSVDYYALSSTFNDDKALLSLYKEKYVKDKNKKIPDNETLKASIVRNKRTFLSIFSDRYKYETKELIVHFTVKDPLKERYSKKYNKLFVDNDRYIAHGGGGINQDTYTNSKEAMNLSYSNGIKLFEFDLQETSDHHIVAVHEWDQWKNLTKFKGEIPPTLKEFKAHLIYGKYSPLTLVDISWWFSTHNDAFLITDKINSPKRVVKFFPFKDRLIMELFTMDAITEARKLNIFSAMPSWTIIRGLDGNIDKIMKVTDKHVALSTTDIKGNIATLLKLKERGIKTYVFNIHINNEKGEEGILCNDLNLIYGVYVDEFSPGKVVCS